MAKKNDGRVFDPSRCDVGFIEPIPEIPEVGDCYVPDVPSPIFSGPAGMTPTLIGPPGPAGPEGPEGPCPTIQATLQATCDGKPTNSRVKVTRTGGPQGCGYNFQFTLESCQSQATDACCQAAFAAYESLIAAQCVTVLTDFRVQGTTLQVKTRAIKVLHYSSESDWTTVHTGTTCQT